MINTDTTTETQERIEAIEARIDELECRLALGDELPYSLRRRYGDSLAIAQQALRFYLNEERIGR